MNKTMPMVILIIMLAGAGYLGWQKYGNKILPTKPVTPAPEKPTEKPLSDLIRVETPAPGSAISGAIEIKGQARGNWFFEATFPIRLESQNGQELAVGIATAQGEWMTEDFVPFTAELDYPVSATTSVVLVLQKDNPSGLPEHDNELRLPITLLPSELMTVLVYFGTNKNDPQMLDCAKTIPVERQVIKTPTVGKAALTELLKGPTEAEQRQGLFTSLNNGVKLNSLVIEKGVARADFDDRLEYQVGGSCRVTAIRAQIENTLKQFPTVKEVVISINGRTEDILQP